MRKCAFKINRRWDFSGGPVIRNTPCKAGDAGFTLVGRTKIPHTLEQLNPCAAATEPVPHI